MIHSVEYGSGRIAAYQVETSPAGAFVALRLQYQLVPGLLVSREFATIDTVYVDTITLEPDGHICVAFPLAQSDLVPKRRQVGLLVPIGPLTTLRASLYVDPNESHLPGCDISRG